MERGLYLESDFERAARDAGPDRGRRLGHATRGARRRLRKLFADAQGLLDRIIAEKWLTARAAFSHFPANALEDDSIEIYTDESREEVLASPTSCASRDRSRLAVRTAPSPTSSPQGTRVSKTK
jgi:hypothetical protein